MTNITVRRFRFCRPVPSSKRLAALDSASPPRGPALVAESPHARMIAALSLGSGRAIADPFEPTAEIVALLELRAAQLARERPLGSHGLGSSGLRSLFGGHRRAPSCIR